MATRSGATDDNFAVDPSTWHAADAERLSRLEDIQQNLLSEIARVATGKTETIRAAVRLGLGLSAAVVVVSALLGWLISRGVTRSIVALATAAVRVQNEKDFSTRVERTSDDELGQLTDAFSNRWGGDYYDVLRVGEADWILIGDVSGHGVTAGLSMMIVQTAVRTLIQSAAADGRPLRPSQLLSQVNAAVRSNLSKIHANQYMTIMALKLEGPRVTFSGLHQDLLVYRAASKSVERITSRGVWIGLMDDISALVEDDSFELHRGDLLLLYTDGVTEALVDGRRPGTSGIAIELRALADTNPDPAACYGPAQKLCNEGEKIETTEA